LITVSFCEGRSPGLSFCEEDYRAAWIFFGETHSFCEDGNTELFFVKMEALNYLFLKVETLDYLFVKVEALDYFLIKMETSGYHMVKVKYLIIFL
jgi:hypothetical protein